MNQKNNPSQLTKLSRATRLRSKNLADRAGAIASDLHQSVEHHITKALHTGANTLVEQLSIPKNAVFLQEQLVKVAQLGFTFGFKIDPNAKKLYNFVQWIEEKHGRQPVMARIREQNLLADRRMLELLTSYASFLSSPAARSGKDPDWKNDDIEDFKQHAGDTLLSMLCELAALESGLAVPHSTSQKIQFFESAPIPEEFHILAAMAAGQRPDAIIMPGQKTKPDPSQPETPSRLNRLTRTIRDNAQKFLDTTSKNTSPNQEDNKPTGLARFIPGLNDPTFHFIVFSYTFFLETYMLRNLIENLPELLEELAPLARSPYPFDDENPENNNNNYADYTDYTDIHDPETDN